MTLRPTTIERAYKLAASGRFATTADIERQLASEGFENVRQHMDGPSLKAALRKLCREARATPPAPAADEAPAG